MKVTVNGKEMLFDHYVNILELVGLIGCNVDYVAIEKNSFIVPRSKYQKVLIEDGDVIECVEFIGGG